MLKVWINCDSNLKASWLWTNSVRSSVLSVNHFLQLKLKRNFPASVTWSHLFCPGQSSNTLEHDASKRGTPQSNKVPVPCNVNWQESDMGFYTLLSYFPRRWMWGNSPTVCLPNCGYYCGCWRCSRYGQL